MTGFLTSPLMLALYIGVGGFWIDRLVWRLWWFWKERVQANHDAEAHDEGGGRSAGIEEVHGESAHQQD